MTSDGWLPTSLEGVTRRTNKALADERGSFMEIWRASLARDLSPSGFVQGNVSVSRTGVLRGMHFHRGQSDLWTIVAGRTLAATTDLRAAIAGGGPVRSQVSDLAFGDSLYIPPYVAHGFWALEETRLLYMVSTEYDGSDEHGFAWNDPLAAIPWPGTDPILSARDAQAPSLSDVLDDFRRSGSADVG